MWVGGVADSQTRSKHLKTSPNHPENRVFDPNFTKNPNLTKTHDDIFLLFSVGVDAVAD